MKWVGRWDASPWEDLIKHLASWLSVARDENEETQNRRRRPPSSFRVPRLLISCQDSISRSFFFPSRGVAGCNLFQIVLRSIAVTVCLTDFKLLTERRNGSLNDRTSPSKVKKWKDRCCLFSKKVAKVIAMEKEKKKK